MLHLDWERVRRLSELAVSYGNPGDSARAAGAGDTGLVGHEVSVPALRGSRPLTSELCCSGF